MTETKVLYNKLGMRRGTSIVDKGFSFWTIESLCFQNKGFSKGSSREMEHSLVLKYKLREIPLQLISTVTPPQATITSILPDTHIPLTIHST
jgi:hypothetical protein